MWQEIKLPSANYISQKNVSGLNPQSPQSIGDVLGNRIINVVQVIKILVVVIVYINSKNLEESKIGDRDRIENEFKTNLKRI